MSLGTPMMKQSMMALLASLLLLACNAAQGNPPAHEQPIKSPPACHVAGCSGQLCTDENDGATTCEWRERYGCYRTATCERQRNGQCDWTMTPELKRCLDSHP